MRSSQCQRTKTLLEDTRVSFRSSEITEVVSTADHERRLGPGDLKHRQVGDGASLLALDSKLADSFHVSWLLFQTKSPASDDEGGAGFYWNAAIEEAMESVKTRFRGMHSCMAASEECLLLLNSTSCQARGKDRGEPASRLTLNNYTCSTEYIHRTTIRVKIL